MPHSSNVTYAAIPKVEALGCPQNLSMEVHQECPDCVLVGLRHTIPQVVLPFYNFIPFIPSFVAASWAEPMC